MSAESIAVWTELCAVFSDSVVSCSVSVDNNTVVLTNGLRGNVMITRALAGKGLADNQDFTVWCLSAVFADVNALRGRTMVIDETTYRITGTMMHASGGIVKLICGEGDRVI